MPSVSKPHRPMTGPGLAGGGAAAGPAGAAPAGPASAPGAIVDDAGWVEPQPASAASVAANSRFLTLALRCGGCTRAYQLASQFANRRLDPAPPSATARTRAAGQPETASWTASTTWSSERPLDQVEIGRAHV